ncbi:hypothetical protein INN71_15125 [Nocardioides sp. ChNu-153]|uniref:hypothetical protein n=1 Tax=unclassified Nocardioides TaxID=2615069 RepID=UPI00240535F5|nr:MULTISPECIES: hypothetical protein [unclassified Nocardioides]MDF9716317.1 hypothetical protein [Nocardioides sp. ChNu-99]MDN7122721.1 hypothetical protein [Nocardioides sp. ChNu-153]
MVRRTWTAAALVATAMGLGAAPAASGAATAPTIVVDDARGDVTLDPYASSGPSFTPRIDPAAVDLERVTVTSNRDTIFVRVDLRKFYGAAKVANRQQGAQSVVVDLYDGTSAFLTGTAIWEVGARPQVTATISERDGVCRSPATVSTSTVDHWILLRLPAACVRSGATLRGAEVQSSQVLEQRNGAGTVTSRRVYGDAATSPGI